MFKWFKKDSVEQKSATSITNVFHDSPFFAGLVASNSAIKGYKNKVVYSVTNALVNKLLEVPIIVTKDGNEKQAKYFRHGKSLNPERLHMAKALGIQEQQSHELLDLFENPNDYQSGIDLKKAFWFNKLLSGAGILWVERGSGLTRKKSIKAIHCIPTYLVRIEESDDWKNPVKRYWFSTPLGGQELELKVSDVMYCGSYNPESMFKGYNPFNSAGSVVDKNNINDLAQMAAFRNGGTGILFSSDTVTDGVGGVSDKMSPENMAMLKDTIAREYAGAANNKRMHFTNGFVNVTSFGDTLADLKLIEASENEVKEICGIFQVSPIIIGEGKSNTESNVVQAYKSLVTNNVVPKLREFDQAFNRFSKDWYKDGVVKVAHDITEFAELMPNMELVQKVYGNNPAVTLNELRLMLGLDERQEELFKKSYIQSGFVPLEDAGFTNAYSQPQNSNSNG